MKGLKASQLPLNIALKNHATFNNFYADGNQEAYSAIEKLAALQGPERYIYVWGSPGVGKSHLLQAACHDLLPQFTAAYFSFADLQDVEPALLEGLENVSLVCLDDIEAAAGKAEWETALFHFYNRIRDAGHYLLVAGRQPPANAGWRLADLRSRLSAGLIYHLRGLSDDGKLCAMQIHAKYRGLELPDEVGHYLLRHCRRDMRALFELLEQLDRASLVARRRLTIPFIKEVIDSANEIAK